MEVETKERSTGGWYCCNCQSLTVLKRNGRCEKCDSDAVDIPVRSADRTVLEKMYERWSGTNDR